MVTRVTPAMARGMLAKDRDETGLPEHHSHYTRKGPRVNVVHHISAPERPQMTAAVAAPPRPLRIGLMLRAVDDVDGQGDPLALVKPVQQTLAALDPRLPLHNPVTLTTLISDGLAGRRLPVVLMTAFGALALVLASVGVYAMFAAMAAAREREFGVRMALGSSRGAIARLVLRQGGVWMVAGLVVGAAGVVTVSRLVRGLLYGVAPFDPVALGLAVVVLIAAAAIALLVPVRRATRVDPITALR